MNQLNYFARVKRVMSIVMGVFAIITMLFCFKIESRAEGGTLGANYSMSVLVSSGGASQTISLVPARGREYLFLPGFASDSKVIFQFDSKGDSLTIVKDGKESPIVSGDATNISGYLSGDIGDGSKILTIHATNAAGVVTSYELNVMKSSAISSIYISSGNPSQGRTFVEASKANKAAGAMTMFNGKGGLVYAGNLTQIKCRGNTTFGTPKKPYQIKIDHAADLAQTGNANNQNKTWILLANAYDPTLIHNTVGYRLAKSMKLDVPDCTPVDLYYDGEYRGSYLLTEKVEFGSGRIEAKSLAKQNTKANGGKNLSANQTEFGKNKYGAEIKYVKGVQNPEKISGGYLIELDIAYYKEERSYFVTTLGVPFVIKSPTNCSKEEVTFISEYVEEMLQAAVNGGTCPSTGKSVWEYVDKESFAKYFILNQIVCNADAFASSTYFYMDLNGGPLKAGPVWDLDDSYGVREDKASPESLTGVGTFMPYFIKLPEFREAVKKYYKTTGYSLATSQGIDKAVKEISASQKMNRVLWEGHGRIYLTLDSYESDINYMKNYASQRAKWLNDEFASW